MILISLLYLCLFSDNFLFFCIYASFQSFETLLQHIHKYFGIIYLA